MGRRQLWNKLHNFLCNCYIYFLKIRVYFITFKTHKKILFIISILTPFYLTELFIGQIKYQYIFVLALYLLTIDAKQDNELSALRAGLKDERRTSNVQHRILNKVFCQFIKRQSTSVRQHKLTDFIHAKAWFDVGRSMLDVQENLLISYHAEFIKHKMEIPILWT